MKKENILFGILLLVITSGCISQYNELEDVGTLTGNAGKILTVNQDENGITYTSIQNPNGLITETKTISFISGPSHTTIANQPGFFHIVGSPNELEQGSASGEYLRIATNTEGYTQARTGITLNGISDLDGQYIYAQFSDNNETWYDLNITNYAATLTDTEGGPFLSPWFDINSDANRDSIYLRMMTNGNQTASYSIPVHEAIIEFKRTIDSGKTYNCIQSPDGNTFTCTTNFQQNIDADQNLNVDGNLLIPNQCITIGAITICKQGATNIKIIGGGDIVFDSNNTDVGTTPSPGGFFRSSAGFIMTRTGGTAALINPNSYFGGITAAPNSGIWFDNTTPKGIQLHLTGTPLHHWCLGSADDVCYWMSPITAPPLTTEGGTIFNYTGTDGNFIKINYGGPDNENWQIAGTYVHDLNATGNIKSDQNILGQLVITQATAGTSCTTRCGLWVNAGPWTCIEVIDTSNTSTTCGSTTGTRDCMCRN